MASRNSYVPPTQKELDEIIQQEVFSDYLWINPKKIVIAQWVRMKCIFGCSNYGHLGTCPPNVPPVSECDRFVKEYEQAVIFHFTKKVQKPEERIPWSNKVNMKLLEVERQIFLAGCERAFLMFTNSCYICSECTGKRETCREPSKARPGPDALAIDVYSTVRQLGFPIEVCKDYNQEMNRYAFLMVR